MNSFIEKLKKHGACREGLDHVKSFKTPQEFWEQTDRIDYLFWLIGRFEKNKYKIINFSTRVIVPFALDQIGELEFADFLRSIQDSETCAEEIASYLDFAIEAADGAAYSACSAAYSVYSAAYSADSADYACSAAYSAAYSAADSAYSAYSAGSASYSAAVKYLCDELRKHFSFDDILKEL